MSVYQALRGIRPDFTIEVREIAGLPQVEGGEPEVGVIGIRNDVPGV